MVEIIPLYPEVGGAVTEEDLNILRRFEDSIKRNTVPKFCTTVSPQWAFAGSDQSGKSYSLNLRGERPGQIVSGTIESFKQMSIEDFEIGFLFASRKDNAHDIQES